MVVPCLEDSAWKYAEEGKEADCRPRLLQVAHILF